MSTVLITGGSGLIGNALGKMLLQKGYQVIILTRKSIDRNLAMEKGFQFAKWDIEKQTIDPVAVQKADFIIHLAGAGVAEKRWSNQRKMEILESRTKSSELIVKSLKEIPNSVKAVASASAIGWYGADPSIPNPNPFKETDPGDHAFLGETCKAWEESMDPITEMGIRLVKLRTGIVLSKDGGALMEFIRPLRYGLATILGNGLQIVSWIHIDDLCRLYIETLENKTLNGVYNAVAPQPVNNKELLLELSKIIKGRFSLPIYVPSFLLKIMMGEMSIEVLKSCTVSCNKIHDSGFQFLYPSIESALKGLLAGER